ncbi:MAG: DegT/DnrJ/EryC1/StrS family aminotransferase [Nitrosotalea sp.]
MDKNNVFGKKSIKVPFFSHHITKGDKKAMMKALDSMLLTDGPILRQFESEFAKFTGAKYAIGISNATAALHLSLKSIGVGKGDEVIVPDMTFVATANAVRLCGATPVFADVEKDDMNISINSIKENLSSRTKAILPVHFAGKVCKIDKIKKIAQSNNLKIIEDCAHAIGAKYNGKHVGNFGSAGCFSFYPTKNITTIEGGMVITNSKEIGDYVRSARNHGITKSLSQRYSHGKPWEYDILESGYNYRLDEIRAALGINQLKRIQRLNLSRKKAFEYYNKNLETIPGIITPVISAKYDNVYHLYIVRIQKNFGIPRDVLFEKLREQGISTSVHYKPLHLFTTFRKLKRHNKSLKNTQDLYNEIISLPLYPNISRKEQDMVIKCIKNAIGK